ncbi:unnamed protein product [Sphagnum jensenii]
MSKSASFFKEIMQVLPNTWVLKLREMRRKSQKQQQPPAADAIDQVQGSAGRESCSDTTDHFAGGKNIMKTPSPRRSTAASSMKTPTLLKAVSKPEEAAASCWGSFSSSLPTDESIFTSSYNLAGDVKDSFPKKSFCSTSSDSSGITSTSGEFEEDLVLEHWNAATSDVLSSDDMSSAASKFENRKAAKLFRAASCRLSREKSPRFPEEAAEAIQLESCFDSDVTEERLSDSERPGVPGNRIERFDSPGSFKSSTISSRDLNRFNMISRAAVCEQEASAKKAWVEKPEPVLDETPNGHCIHTLVIMPDLGRTCTQCGLVTERIEHMSFIYHAPRYLRNPSSKGRKAQDPYCSIPDGEELQESLLTMSGLEVHPSLEDRMHPHQLEGFKFLSRNLVEEDGGGCMLAFAPGTGKSFLVISFIQSFLVQMPDAKPLIVVPKGMLLPWVREFKKWEVQEITTFNLYEAQSCVDSQLSMLQKWQRQERSVLLVGYSQFVNMTGEVGRLLTEGPGLLILDEGHLARTKDTKILKSLMQVRTKRRVLLSGTPFNNNFDEFYNTLELVRPGFMQQASALLSPVANALEPFWSETVAAGSIPSPTKKSGNVGRQAFKDVIVERIESGTQAGILTALKQLRILIAPFVAWHKGQILETLPGISDFTIMLHLTPAQKHSLALAEKHDIRDNLQKGPAAIYVHPILEQVGEKKRSQDDLRLQENVNVKDGAKLRWVTDLMRLCDAAGEKLLIFSEYLYSLALIENVIAHRMGWGKGLQILRIDGKTHLLEREKIVKSFNEGQDARVLCASIKACGEGISLVGASRVVLLEVPWNPAVARQAISRAFRIGQKKKVVVYRLIAADTQEEKNMHESSTRKEWLSRLLFDQSIGNSHTSILWDVTGKCSDRFLDQGPLMEGVRNVLEREF